MWFERLLQSIAIPLPIFAMIGVGAWCQAKGWLGDGTLPFINRVLYYGSLPALIFLGVAGTAFSELIMPAIIVGTLVATVAGGALGTGVAMLSRQTLGLRGALAVSPYWANVTYVGFPLAAAAFPEDGLRNAGIVNAFAMPAFVMFGTATLILFTRGGSDEGADKGAGEAAEDDRPTVLRSLVSAVVNPIVLSAFVGLAASWCIGVLGWRDPQALPVVVGFGTDVFTGFLRLLGTMGLPLALIAVGANLRFHETLSHIGLLVVTSVGKLIVTPLLTLLFIVGWFPNADPAALGTAVILMGTPGAVAMTVIAQRFGAAPGFVNSHLLVSTLAATVTIPAWLFVLLTWFA